MKRRTPFRATNTGRLGFCFAALLITIAPFANALMITETFEDETNSATTFQETGGPLFSVTGDLLVEQFGGLGSEMSDFWLGTGFAGAGNGSTGSSGNIGSINVAAGWSFTVGEFDVWLGINNGGLHFPNPGQVKFIGTKVDTTTVEETLTFNTPSDLLFELNRSFTGSLQGMALTSLSIELVTGAPLDYFAIDNIELDVVRLSTPPPPRDMPEPSSLLLAALGGCLLARRRVLGVA